MRQGASQFSSLSLYGRDLPPHPGPSPLARGGIAARRIPKSEALIVMETRCPSPRTSRVRENGLLSLTLSSRGGEGDALRLLGACYKQVTPNGVCCGSGVQSAKFHFGERRPFFRKRSGLRDSEGSSARVRLHI